MYSRNDFLFLGRMNIWYHENRERFYDRFINWTAFSSLLLSSAAFIALGPLFPEGWASAKEWVIALATLGVTALNGAILAFGMYSKFVTHVDLKRQWIAFLSLAQQTDDAGLDTVSRAFEELNAREPAPNTKVLDQAHDKTRQALGWVQPAP